MAGPSEDEKGEQDEKDEKGEIDERGFRALTEKIARDRGFLCGNYKDGCLRRRLAVRMRSSGAADFDAYAAVLDQDVDEYERLLNALTINVTRLFRDAAVWDAVAASVIPERWDAHPPRFQVWSAGCASGEELYTLAALLHRHADRTGSLDRLARCEVIGSDIDRRSLEAAERARYPAEAFVEVPSTIRERYFSAAAPHEAAAELRALVRVEHRDVLREEMPATGLQLIVCRNVLIYLDRASQEPLLRRLHAALAPGGYLVLGKAETMLGPIRGLFETVDSRQRVFRRSASP